MVTQEVQPGLAVCVLHAHTRIMHGRAVFVEVMCAPYTQTHTHMREALGSKSLHFSMRVSAVFRCECVRECVRDGVRRLSS